MNEVAVGTTHQLIPRAFVGFVVYGTIGRLIFRLKWGYLDAQWWSVTGSNYPDCESGLVNCAPWSALQMVCRNVESSEASNFSL
jgi:hypothetical protein